MTFLTFDTAGASDPLTADRRAVPGSLDDHCPAPRVGEHFGSIILMTVIFDLAAINALLYYLSN